MSISLTANAKGSVKGILYSDRRKFNVSDKIAELTPSETPFLTMLVKAKKRTVNDPDIKDFEHRAHWLDNLTFSASANCTDVTSSKVGATVTVKLKISNDVNVALRSGSMLQILDADASNKFANVLLTGAASLDNTASSYVFDGKLVNDTPGFAPAAGDNVLRIGSAFEEGAAKTTGYSDQLETIWASTQIFKTHYSLTNTAVKTDYYAGSEYQRIRADKLREHKIDIERTLLFGARVGSASANPFSAPGSGTLLGSTHPLRTSHGIVNAITYGDTNIGIGGSREFNNTMATYSYSDFIDDMEEVFEYGSPRKAFFCGMGVISFFQKMAMDEAMLTIETSTSSFGLDVYTVKTPAGMLDLVWNPLLRGSSYKNFGVVVDMANVDVGVFRPTSLEMNVQTPGTDGIEEQYLSDLGLVVRLPETHSIFRFS